MIQSESQFLWKLLLDLLLTPVVFIQILFNRRSGKDLLKPFFDFMEFVMEAKLTFSLVVLNVVLYLFSLFFSESLLTSLLHYPTNLFNLNIYTLITAGFLHASLTHLLGNMLALFIFGRVVEEKLGSVKMGLVYFGALILSGVFSSLIHTFLLNDNTPGLGASGAIMGLVSTAILLNPFYLTYELLVPLPIMLIGWLTVYLDIIGVLNPSEDGIGHLAHLGGFLSIALIAYFMNYPDREKMRKGFWINVISLFIIAAAYYFFFLR